MRLTIRTLLGYMDDILDPQDAEEMGKRIEESEVATTLYHRIRDVMRRLSLKAPDLDEEGGGVDPNTVAEYLDNVLPDDRVQDFEKVCLESDIHLAEVAACHQILAVALGEAAEIEPASREQMYQLPQVAADLANMNRPPSDPFGMAINETDQPATKIPRRPTPVVPDYLRESPRRVPTVPIVMGAIVAICLLIVVLAVSGVFGPWGPQQLAQGDKGDQPSQPLGEKDPLPVTSNPIEGSAGTPTETPTETDPGATPTSPDPGSLSPSTPEVTPNPGASEGTPGEAGTGDEPSPTGATPPEGTGPSPATETPTSPTDPSTPTSPGDVASPSVPGALGDLQPPVSPGDEPLGPTPVPSNPTELPGPATSPGETPSPGTPGAGTSGTGETPPSAVEPEQQALIGRFVSENQALVRFDSATNSWKIVPQQGVLTTATSLASLSLFRPIVATPSGLSVQLLGESQVAMEPTKGDATPILKLQRGQVILRSLGKQNVRVLLMAGGKSGVVTLVNPDSAAAIGLFYHREPGRDPAEVASRVEVQFYTISGTVLWEEKDKNEPLQVDASEYIVFTKANATPKIEVLTQPPSWIQSPPISKLDQNAMEEILKAFDKSEIASLTLRELLEHRQKEVSRMALKCLTQLGQLEAAVASLDNANEKLTWDQTIGQLSELASQSPEMAKQIKEAFEREYGGSALELWRMLWGYTPQQLENDGAIQLVDYLEHDRLVFRVMSFYNLNRITGKSLYYKPEDTPIQRKTPISRWRSEFQKGKIGK